jgi:hypothetical protein
MLSSDSSDSRFLGDLLQLLLEDFQTWFTRASLLIEEEAVSFLDVDEVADLLARLDHAQNELRATQSLAGAVGYQVGVDVSMLLVWHQLASECWHIAIRARMEQSLP